MLVPFLLFFTTFFSAAALLSDTYICDIEYLEDMSSDTDVLNTKLTTIFFLDQCRAGKSELYQEEFGRFRVQILCKDFIEICVTPGEDKEIIRENWARKYVFTYVYKQSGLQISCQGKDIRVIKEKIDEQPEPPKSIYSLKRLLELK